jgi:glycosyltransferase involved in cell wall biosynthesis
MRLLLVTDWPALEAGTERCVERLREGLIQAGDDVRLLTSSAGSAAGGTADYVAYGTSRPSQQALLQVFNPFAYASIQRALSEFQPEAVQLNMFLPYMSPAILPPLRDIPTVMAIHDYKPICPRSTKLLPDGSPCSEPAGEACRRHRCVGAVRQLREAPRYQSFRHGLRSVNRVATLSRWMRGELALNGIEADLIEPPVPGPATGFVRRPGPKPLFIYAGRLAPVKGLDVLLAAFAELRQRVPEALLGIVGDGPLRGAVVRRARKLGLDASVSFSFGMRPDWHGVLEQAWAVVVPSVYREPLGIVAIEAILHDVPVIASAAGGLAETVKAGETGIPVPSRDPSALADAMETISTRRAFPSQSIDSSARAAIGRRYDPADHVRRMRSIFEEVSAERRVA